MDYSVLQTYVQDGLIGLFIILAGMIKIPKIEINLWSMLAKKIGNALNKDVMEKVDKLAKDLDEHRKEGEEEAARFARSRILRCEGELLKSKGEPIYSKEAFEDLLDDIDRYNDYCDEHEDFENSKAVLAIKYIKNTYQEYQKENKFLS